ncbi:hypothetical protein DFH08DRAFT_388532 [Mycena albidolilacea]|uniref:Uncharacterized protein n=1 Tax=Mycena albidolilacea TaxID=1033008 RepID=A0AAD7EFL3_9AGAR|nr:hypothetical protein DFH08DRAFT_388532 [Mycena albidolilacea]
MAPIALDAASFLGCVFESLGFGLMTVMSGFTLRALLGNGRQRTTLVTSRNRRLLVVLSLIWILSAAHWTINVYRAYSAFMLFPEGPVAFYNTLSLSSYTARNTVYCMLTVLADGFAVYRAYVVWQRKWWIAIVPAILLVGTLVTGIGVIYTFTRVTPGNVVFIAEVVPWVTSYVTMTLATNVVCTSLIALRIIRNRMSFSPVGLARNSRDPLWTSLIIILESAALYSSALIVLIVLYLLGSNAQYVALDITVSSIGIAFVLIILRVTLGLSSDAQSNGGGSTSDASRLARSANLSVNVARLVEVNRDQYSDIGTGKNGPVVGRESDSGSFRGNAHSKLPV